MSVVIQIIQIENTLGDKMKKIMGVIITLLLLNLIGCTTSYNDIHKSISDDYKDITIESYLEKSVLTLDFNNDMKANLILFNGYYVIDFNHETSYFYDINHKKIIKYKNTVDTEYHAEAESILEFIYKIEKAEDIKFNKVNYLIFDVIRSALKEENKQYVQFNEKRPNAGFYHPYLVIKKENFGYIDKLTDIFSDIDESIFEVKFIMDRHLNTNIMIEPFHIEIESQDYESLSTYLLTIIDNI